MTPVGSVRKSKSVEHKPRVEVFGNDKTNKPIVQITELEKRHYNNFKGYTQGKHPMPVYQAITEIGGEIVSKSPSDEKIARLLGRDIAQEAKAPICIFLKNLVIKLGKILKKYFS